MEREDRRAALLDHYWDAVQRGEPPALGNGIDIVARAVIEQLGRQPAPAPEHARLRIRKRLTENAKGWQPLVPANGTANVSGHVSMLSPPFSRPHHPAPGPLPSAILPIASALLLLLVIASSALLLVPGRSFTDRPAVLPAPSDTTLDVLVDVTIPERYNPRWQTAIAELFHATIPPNSAMDLDSAMLRVDYVIDGQYTMRSDAPTIVMRAGDPSPTEIPPGTEIALHAGDATITPPDSVLSFANPEATPADVLSWHLMKNHDSKHFLPRGWVERTAELRQDLQPRAGPIAFHLTRSVLAPDAAIPAPPEMLQMAVAVSENAKDYTVAKTRDGGRRNLGKEPVTLMVVTIGAAPAVTLMP